MWSYTCEKVKFMFRFAPGIVAGGVQCQGTRGGPIWSLGHNYTRHPRFVFTFLIKKKILKLLVMQVKTILYLPLLLTQASSVVVTSRVTTLIQKLTVNHFMFVPTLEMETWPSTVSSVLMEPCSISSTSSVTGGSMWTVQLLKTSTVSMKILL